MPRATHDHTPSPSRRRLLTGSAASLLATVAAVAAVRAATPTGDDAEIIRLCERLLQPEAEQDALLACSPDATPSQRNIEPSLSGPRSTTSRS
jgi:hypothetical protein